MTERGRFNALLPVPIAIAGLLVFADQVTKWIVEAKMAIGERIDIIPGFFSLAHIKNRGAAFGFLNDVDSQWISVGFAVLAIVATCVLTLLYRSTPKSDLVSRVAFVIIGAGAIGNLVDRVRLGAVTDFLLFYVGQFYWPAFNVADSLITVGVCLLGYRILVNPLPDSPL